MNQTTKASGEIQGPIFFLRNKEGYNDLIFVDEAQESKSFF